MTDILVVLCTFPDREQARQIGTILVESQLAACVNLCPSVESIYRWEGKMEQATEVLALIKTTREGFAALEEALLKLHPYDVPEIVALAPEAVHELYAAWVKAETGSRPAE